MRLRILALSLLVLGVAAAGVLAAPADGPPGRIEGQVTAPGGVGLAGVRVAVEGLPLTAETDAGGRFSIEVPPGTWSLTFARGDDVATAAEVVVRSGETTRVDQPVPWLLNVADSITVTSASRRRERIVEAPAAVTPLSQTEIERQSSHGQVPRLLAATPGAELTQSGTYDFNLNLRGFNTFLNRRVLVLIDGRDPSLPYIGCQEWPSFSFPLYDIESMELVRGPASALYGTDAFNGVLNVVTRPPRESQGGTVQFAMGELSTRRLDARYSRALGGGWYAKVVGGTQESRDFTRSRSETVEYAGLPLEAIPQPLDQVDIDFGGLRIDKDLAGGTALLTVEGGQAASRGTTGLSTVGRIQPTDVRRPWVRLNFNTPRFNLLAARTVRDADGLVSLVTGSHVVLNSYRTNAELQSNAELFDGRSLVVGGVSYTEIHVDSANPAGVQTVMFQPETEDRFGLFGQADWRFGDRLKAVAALRWDKSSLRDGRFSPKGALVWSIRPGQTLRLSYNEAFQSPNFGELYTQIEVGQAIDLSALEAALAPALGGVPLGLGHIPVLALGNSNLDVEEVRSAELGYSGILGRNVYLTVDLYHNRIENFVSTLLPQLGTSLGRINPEFGPYRPPAALTPQAAALVLATLGQVLPPEVYALLSNNLDGSPILAALSFTNAGRVTTDGVDVAVQWSLPRGWAVGLAYTHLDFDIEKEAAESPILPNTADDRVHATLSYVGSRFDTHLAWRWADGFFWSGGLFRGPVPSYRVLDWSGNYELSKRWSVGVDIANVLDDEHYEVFGGDLLGRRALGHVTLSW